MKLLLTRSASLSLMTLLIILLKTYFTGCRRISTYWPVQSSFVLLNKITLVGNSRIDDALVQMGLLHKKMGQVDLAEAAFEDVIEYHPDSEYVKLAQMELTKLLINKMKRFFPIILILIVQTFALANTRVVYLRPGPMMKIPYTSIAPSHISSQQEREQKFII